MAHFGCERTRTPTTLLFLAMERYATHSVVNGELLDPPLLATQLARDYQRGF